MLRKFLERTYEFFGRVAAPKGRVLYPVRPIISFTFDDIPRSAFTNGGGILRKHGFSGTYYLSMGLSQNTYGSGELFRPSDLRAILADGHEIGCHTYRHLSFSYSSRREIAADLRFNRQAIENACPGCTVRHFSFPYGQVSLGGWWLVSQRYESCRGVENGVNCPAVRLNRLLANKLYERIPLAQNLLLIHENAERGGWLIFYTHDVTELPSPFGCTPEYFETVVSAAARSGAHVLPISDAIKMLSDRQTRGTRNAVELPKAMGSSPN